MVCKGGTLVVAWVVLSMVVGGCITTGAMAASVAAKESEKVMSKLEALCRDKCAYRLAQSAGDDACTRFCAFTKHIRVAHEKDVYDLFLENRRNMNPLVRVCSGA